MLVFYNVFLCVKVTFRDLLHLNNSNTPKLMVGVIARRKKYPVVSQKVIHKFTTTNYYFLYLYFYKKIKLVVVGAVDKWITFQKGHFLL